MPSHSIAELSSHHLPDLSLDHLPDLSDNSDNSFQIPASADTDYLLAEPSDDFLADEDTIGTPIAVKRTHKDLRLSDLTPRPSPSETAKCAPEEKLATHTMSRPSKTRLKPSEVCEASTSAPRSNTKPQTRIHADKKTPPIGQTHARADRPIKKRSGNKLRPARHSTEGSGDVYEGNATDRKEERSTLKEKSPPDSDTSYPANTDQHVAVELEVAPRAQPRIETARVDQQFLDVSFADVTMDAAIGGAAGRLLMYSQSIMPPVARSGGRSIASAAVHVPAAPSATCDDPLTLSQLPPRKVEARAVQEPISPIRVSNKRPTSPDDSSEPRKREKRTHPAKPQSKSKADSLNSGRDKARKRKGARSRKPPSQEKSVNNQSHKENDGHVSGIRHLPITDRPNGLLPAQKPTKPIEFHFKSELRLNVRRAEHAESSRTTLKQSANRYANPIPDFKALHAAQDASLAARREHIRRLVPPPLELNTEVRAREREKFEETRRAREQEIQREMEERRRQKEIEEEKEIRELRKRAVPKANAIPDWYADAPKKKGAVSRARSDVA